MLPTFVIGLREGLEAALIVGIIAAFLRKQGRVDLVRWVFVGVATAVLLCLAVGVGLDLLSKDLPQRQQEGLETVIGVLAVGMVTYMVVWMRRHSRELKGQLEGLATEALGAGGSRSGRAMVVMAFLAVLREGLETVVFLLAAFNESQSNGSAAAGAVIGIAVAVVLGYGIYRGGVRLNLSKFFRATGLVLVLVAAGLVVNALHTAHEAGWLNFGQTATFNLSWLVSPGSVRSSLLTGMLGLQPTPVQIEVVGWLLYLVPVGVYVAWPPARGVAPRTAARLVAGAGALCLIVAGVLLLAAPTKPAQGPTTSAGTISAAVVSRHGDSVLLRTENRLSDGSAGAPTSFTLACTDSASSSVVPTQTCTMTRDQPAPGLPTRLTSAQVAALNGGRLPIGLTLPPGATVPATHTLTSVLTARLDPLTDRVLDLAWKQATTATVSSAGAVGDLALSQPESQRSWSLPGSSASAAADAATTDEHARSHRQELTSLAGLVAGAGGLVAVTGVIALLALSRRRPAAEIRTPVRVLLKH